MSTENELTERLTALQKLPNSATVYAGHIAPDIEATLQTIATQAAELEKLRETVANVTRERDEAVRHIQRAGGYHARTPREIEIANALEDTPEAERESADNAISELLALVDAGRNRLFAAIAERDEAKTAFSNAHTYLVERTAERDSIASQLDAASIKLSAIIQEIKDNDEIPIASFYELKTLLPSI